jgi:hypothetical protein
MTANPTKIPFTTFVTYRSFPIPLVSVLLNLPTKSNLTIFPAGEGEKIFDMSNHNK